ncbi:MAG TPA: PLD nuclease N-terminal domain-containing protein [Rubricoccaceae bacterium]|nr:PLD nuclease N-terminal domain-containing protein [Rubricoccaceae bacterium]
MNRLRSLPVAVLGVLTLALAGCGPDTVLDGLRNPFATGVCGLIVLVLDVIAIVEVLNSARPTGEKVLWCLVIFFFPFIGLLAYWFFGKK